MKTTEINENEENLWTVQSSVNKWETINSKTGSIEDTKADSSQSFISKDDVREILNKEFVPQIKKEVNNEIKKRTEKKTEELRDKLFTLFWVFASVVAFLLMEVQILNNACSKWMMIWLSLILLWCLSFFVVLIKFILSFDDNFDFKKDFNWKSPIGVAWLLALGLIAVGILFACWWDELKCRTDTIIQQYEKNLLNDLERSFRFR